MDDGQIFSVTQVDASQIPCVHFDFLSMKDPVRALALYRAVPTVDSQKEGVCIVSSLLLGYKDEKKKSKSFYFLT